MRSLKGSTELCTSSPSCPSGIQFEVKRVELQGSATLFCCWLVKDLLHSHRDSATRTRLFLASLPSSTHSMAELSGSSFGEVGICGQLSLLCTSTVLQVSQVASLPFCLEWVEGMPVAF